MEYHAAMITVPPDWTADTPIGLTADTATRIQDEIRSGMRVLIFKSSPINAIVAEGEVHDQLFIKLDDWPGVNVRQRPLTAWGQRAEYMLPLRILYTREADNTIPLTTVTEWAGSPINVEWIPLERDAYQELSNWP